jgi:hypothetical protein
MKPTIIVILLFISVAANCQLYLLIDPGTRRAGLLYNQKTQSKVGLYSKAQYGYIDFSDFHTQSIKIGLGLSRELTGGARIYVGLNYNHYYDTQYYAEYIDMSRIKKVCFDIGLATGNEMRFRMMLITDPINWESSLGFSYRFSKY